MIRTGTDNHFFSTHTLFFEQEEVVFQNINLATSLNEDCPEFGQTKNKNKNPKTRTGVRASSNTFRKLKFTARSKHIKGTKEHYLLRQNITCIF